MRSNATQFTSLGSTLAPPPQPPPHQQQMVMNGSVISAPVFMPQQQRPPQQMFLNPSQSMNQLGQMSAAPSTARMVSQPYLPSATPIPMNFPGGPLPQTPKAFHPQQQQLPQLQQQSGYKMMQHDPSSDSISSAQNFQMMSGQQQQQHGYPSGKQITDSPQLSSSGRGSGRTDDSTDSGSIPRAPSPLSMSKPHKLVPGRMTTPKERKREIPSTAV